MVVLVVDVDGDLDDLGTSVDLVDLDNLDGQHYLHIQKQNAQFLRTNSTLKTFDLVVVDDLVDFRNC